MKEFSLEEYLKNPERKVVTRDGRPVRIICTDRKGATPIIALVNDGLSEELGHAFYSDGKIFSDEDNELDLFFASEKHEGWVTIYRDRNMNLYTSNPFESEETAIDFGKMQDIYIKTIKIKWEE